MTTYNKWQKLKRYALVKEKAKRLGYTLHSTKAGILCRKGGRIRLQAFTMNKVEQILDLEIANAKL